METKQTDKPSETYNSSEVRKKLGISPSRLTTLVEQGIIEKVTPPGYKHGYYTKKSVDQYYRERQLFHQTYSAQPEDTTPKEQETNKTHPNNSQQASKETSRPVFTVATAEDMEAVTDLAQRAINKITPTAETRRAWLRGNPESTYVVKHNNKVVAFFHFLPVKHERLMEFMAGNIRGWEITTDEVELFEAGKPLECLLIIASEQEVDETTRINYVRVLLRGILSKLQELGKNGISITKFYATSETPTGIAMALHFGMKEYGQKIGKRMTFVMDIEKSQSRLLRDYKRELAAKRKQQEKQTTTTAKK